ncbi:hypothetical protein AVEN_201679-1 [Araneus ventricosus]|uniref:Uncharacterized protein n=1 Tax=Araneus ventricosus TaxID=182803 RepID=A0A4Y2F8J4_ARAVE|nr:hypothetical protein AVEN_201679-1 [Araneus ventricosus]
MSICNKSPRCLSTEWKPYLNKYHPHPPNLSPISCLLYGNVPVGFFYFPPQRNSASNRTNKSVPTNPQQAKRVMVNDRTPFTTGNAALYLVNTSLLGEAAKSFDAPKVRMRVAVFANNVRAPENAKKAVWGVK